MATEAQQIAQWLYESGLDDWGIAVLVNCERSTINRIRHGRESGRNLLQRLRRIYNAVRQNQLARG